jgi:protein-disulfide isomerase
LSEQLPPEVEPVESSASAAQPIEFSTDAAQSIGGVIKPRPDRSPRSNQWIVLVAFLIGVLIGAFGFAAYNIFSAARASNDTSILREAARNGFMDAVATLNAGGSPSAGGSNDSAAPVPASFKERDANRLGDKNAKVTVIEFADFQCPYCERWFQQVEPQIVQQYVQTGKVTFVYKHSAFLGQESDWAATAAECAADQNKFWAYHDVLFKQQNGENQGAFTKDKLIGFAQQLELDMSKFTPCLQNDQTLARVQADTQEGQQASVSGTPTFFINGQRIVGAQPFSTFQAAIEKALAQ